MSDTIDNQGNLDVNGDGVPDEVVYTTVDRVTTLSVFINEGNGTYRAPQTFPSYYGPADAPKILFTTSGTYVYTKLPLGEGSGELAKLKQDGVFETTTTPLANIGVSVPPPAVNPSGPIDPVATRYITVQLDEPPGSEYTAYREEEFVVSPADPAAKLSPDTILLGDTIFYGQEAVPTDTVIAEAHSGSTYDLIIQQSLFGGGLSFVSLLSPGTLEPATGVPCYCRGTRILTDHGEVTVEDLQVGDTVVTAVGNEDGLESVRWLGHRRLAIANQPVPADVTPIRIRAGAFAEGKPNRDLLVSPGHRLLFHGTLVRAIELVNGSTITSDDVDWVGYWHVELDQHSILIAEGVAAESYLDIGNRTSFENGSITTLHPVLDGDAPQPCFPYEAPSVTLREHLVRRAEALGWFRTGDAEPWLEISGCRITPARRGNRYRFALPTSFRDAYLRSRAARPCDANPRSTDWRRLGVAVVSMTLAGPDGSWDVPLQNARLSDGFSHLEQDPVGWVWRWTDGAARLPLAALLQGRRATMLEVTLDATDLLYWVIPGKAEALPQAG